MRPVLLLFLYPTFFFKIESAYKLYNIYLTEMSVLHALSFEVHGNKISEDYKKDNGKNWGFGVRKILALLFSVFVSLWIFGPLQWE